MTRSHSQTPVTGNYRIIVSNALGKETSNVIPVTIELNAEPSISLQIFQKLERDTFRYAAGDTIRFLGSGFDPEDGPYASDKMSWQVDFHHDDHRHPGPLVKKDELSYFFIIPVKGETATNVWYTLTASVTDSRGRKGTTVASFYPKLSEVSFSITPPGLQFILDGHSHQDVTSFFG